MTLYLPQTLGPDTNPGTDEATPPEVFKQQRFCPSAHALVGPIHVNFAHPSVAIHKLWHSSGVSRFQALGCFAHLPVKSFPS